jgi:diguanylate cyclase (GGDEF)-like protein
MTPAPRHARTRHASRLARLAWLGLALLWPALAGAAPTREAGLPLVYNFTSADYGSISQSWSITQGKDGVIYVGNVSDGVLEFDGAHWSHVPVPNRFVVRSLATAPDGRIYVGTIGDFGYLQRDATGKQHFVSLLDLVPAAERGFADVWNIEIARDAVYFSTLTRIFRLQAGKLTVIKPRNRFHISFLVNDTLYVIDTGTGLTRVVGDHTELVPDGAKFADERIYAMLPWPGPGAQAKPGELLVASRSRGWFLYDGQTFRPWPTAVDAALNQAAIYGAIWLAGGNIAVATQRDGVFVIDTQGRLVSHLTRANGLATNTIYAMYQDDQRGLWLATGEGITRVDIGSALTAFDDRNGLPGIVLGVARRDGVLYAGSTEGAFRLTTAADGTAAFVPEPALPGKNVSFLKSGDQLLAAGTAGVYAWHADGSVHPIVGAEHAQRTWSTQPMLATRRQPDRVFIGFKDGLGEIHRDGQRWVDEGFVGNVREQADSLAEDARGNLWLGLMAGGVGRLALPHDWTGPNDPRTPALQRFGTDAGLPEGTVAVTTVNDQVRFLTRGGIYRFDPATRRFAPDPAFERLFPDGPRRVVLAHQLDRHTLWLSTANDREGIKEAGRALYANGRWRWQPTPLQTLAGVDFNALATDPDGVAWLSSGKGLYRFDPARQPRAVQPLRALLRGVTIRDARALAIDHAPDTVPRLPANDNALRFDFAAPAFTDFAATRYQVRMEGADANWSPWSDATYRDYTNLDSGSYRLVVRARNVYGEVSAPATFRFRILAPWYRTWWAWLAWLAAAVAIVIAITRWRAHVLVRRNLELAELVRQRNAELAEANQALQGSNERLAQQSMTDPLTGLRNRRYLYDHIEVDLATARRHQANRTRGDANVPDDDSLVFLMLDIDHFKPVNDTWGHAAGDRVLQQIADILRATTREADFLTRWGGEEFLLVARFVRADAGALFAERIRSAVAAHVFTLDDGGTLHVTCSIGFATYPAFDQAASQPGWEQVVHLADECLYAAKEHGRNAWAGLLPIATPPAGDITEALHAALAQPQLAGPVRVTTSWDPPSAGE